MRKIAEIRQDLSGKIAEVKALNAAENADALQKGIEDVKALTRELDEANEVEAAEQRLAEKKFAEDKAKGHSFSYTKFMRELSEGGLTGLEKEAAEMGRDEYRRLGLKQMGQVVPSAVLRSAAGQNYGTNADGGYMKEVAPIRYVDALRAKLVVAQLGATVLGDLVGTVPVVSASDLSAGWLAEAATGSISKSTIARAEMTPHRNFVAGAVTKDLLRQTSIDVEAMIQEKLMNAHAQIIDIAAIAGTGSSNQPTGILNHASVPVVAVGTNGGAITWANVVKLETTVNNNNANRGKMAYLTNAKVWGALKTVEKASNTARFLLEEGMLNGYKAEWTSNVPSDLTKGSGSSAVSNLSAMIFGNFEDLYIGQWGGIDLVVDPYTLATSGEIRFVLNAYNDVLVAEPKSFAVIKDITTD